jgi:hypothetical protein
MKQEIAAPVSDAVRRSPLSAGIRLGLSRLLHLEKYMSLPTNISEIQTF